MNIVAVNQSFTEGKMVLRIITSYSNLSQHQESNASYNSMKTLLW